MQGRVGGPSGQGLVGTGRHARGYTRCRRYISIAKVANDSTILIVVENEERLDGAACHDGFMAAIYLKKQY